MTKTVGFPQYNLHKQERKATFVLFLIIYIFGGLRIWGKKRALDFLDLELLAVFGSLIECWGPNSRPL